MVPEKIMLLLLWMRASAVTGSSVLATEALSPVSDPSSVLKVVVFMASRRESAGTLSPTLTKMMSPGTSSAAGRSLIHLPSRKTHAFSGCSCREGGTDHAGQVREGFIAQPTACLSFTRPISRRRNKKGPHLLQRVEGAFCRPSLPDAN